MATIEVTIRVRYTITDDLKEREKSYGPTDLQECIDIDAEGDAEMFIMMAEDDPVIVLRAVSVNPEEIP